MILVLVTHRLVAFAGVIIAEAEREEERKLEFEEHGGGRVVVWWYSDRARCSTIES